MAYAWEQRKLSNVSEIIGGGTPSTTNSEYWDGDINWYAPAEIGEQIYVDESQRKITKLGLEKSSARMLPASRTVLFTSRAGIGKTAILRRPACTNQGFQSMVLNDETNPYFVYSMTDMIKEKAERVASGSTFAEISGKMLGNLEFMFPSKVEQDKIGYFFEQLDNLITLHQRKYVIFIIFHSVWEQRKLGELSSSFEYGLNAAAKEFDGKNKYIRITDIDDDSREFNQNSITSPDTDLADAENYKLTVGDILFARTGASVGKTYIYKASDGLVYYAGFLIRARIKEDYNPEFVFQNTLTTDYDKFIKVTSMRSGQPGVNAQEYSQFEIKVPCKSEQDKISAFFRSLDNLITLHQRAP